MPVVYNSKAIIPAPIVNIQKEYIKSGDGVSIGTVFNIILTGTIVAHKGSPDSSGNFWTVGGYPPDEVIPHNERLKAIIRKQGGLRQLFKDEGKILEIIPLDGSTPLSCNPRVVNIEFSEAIWVDRCDYTITLQANTMRFAGVTTSEDSFLVNGQRVYLTQAEENWTIELEPENINSANQKAYRVSHSVTATGSLFYNSSGVIEKQPWEYAKMWTVSRLGFSSGILNSFASSIFATLPSTAYNKTTTESVDQKQGTVTVTETWLVAPDIATEIFTVNTNTSLESGLTTITIDGTITGLETDSVSKYDNAISKFNTVSSLLFNRAQTYAGIVLNTIPLSTVTTKNPTLGVITYTFSYDNRPSNLVPNAKSESIVIIDDNQQDIIAQLVAPGRIKGPILQNINTKTAKSRTLNIELVMPIPIGDNIATLIAAEPNVSDLVEATKNTLLPAFQIFVTGDEKSWDVKTGRYSRQVRWTYEQ